MRFNWVAPQQSASQTVTNLFWFANSPMMMICFLFMCHVMLSTLSFFFLDSTSTNPFSLFWQMIDVSARVFLANLQVAVAACMDKLSLHVLRTPRHSEWSGGSLSQTQQNGYVLGPHVFWHLLHYGFVPLLVLMETVTTAKRHIFRWRKHKDSFRILFSLL